MPQASTPAELLRGRPAVGPVLVSRSVSCVLTAWDDEALQGCGFLCSSGLFRNMRGSAQSQSPPRPTHDTGLWSAAGSSPTQSGAPSVPSFVSSGTCGFVFSGFGDVLRRSHRLLSGGVGMPGLHAEGPVLGRDVGEL